MRYELNKVIALNIPDIGGVVVTVDKEADFGQIILRARRAGKMVNVRLVSLGNKIETELWEGKRLSRIVTINADEFASKVVDKDIREFLFG